MTTVSKEEFKKSIIKYFEQNSKMTIMQAKKTIKLKMLEDEFDNSISANNVRLFYTDNKNYAEGGAGWYLTNLSFAGGGCIKL